MHLICGAMHNSNSMLWTMCRGLHFDARLGKILAFIFFIVVI